MIFRLYIYIVYALLYVRHISQLGEKTYKLIRARRAEGGAIKRPETTFWKVQADEKVWTDEVGSRKLTG